MSALTLAIITLTKHMPNVDDGDAPTKDGAGAPEIEITDEMIAAGVMAFEAVTDLAFQCDAYAVVERVYSAMGALDRGRRSPDLVD
jgi:hypothetical protein